MSLRKLSRNAIVSAGATIASALLMFELYRFIVREIGIEHLGIWSLVLAMSTLIRLAEIGVGASASRFVALYLGREEINQAATTVAFGFLFVAGTVGIACLAFEPAVRWLVDIGIEHQANKEIAESLIGWTLLAVWLSAIAAVLASSLDGMQRADLRVFGVLGGSLVQLLLAYWFLPTMGVEALGPIQVAMAAVQLGLLFLFAFGCLFQLGARVLEWNTSRIRDLFKFSMGLQLTAVGQFLFEPTIRWSLTLFAGLQVVGYYELSSRAVIQLRQVISSAFQMLVPHVANRLGTDFQSQSEIRHAYERVARVLLVVITPYYLLIASVLPFFMSLWAGEYSVLLISIAYTSFCGWLLNSLAIPAYMMYMALGKSRWLAFNQLLIGVLSLVFSWIGGYFFGGIGVVVGAMAALAIASQSVIWRFHSEYEVPTGALFPKSFLLQILLGFIALGFFLYQVTEWAGNGQPSWLLAIPLLILASGLLAVLAREPEIMNIARRVLSRQSNV